MDTGKAVGRMVLGTVVVLLGLSVSGGRAQAQGFGYVYGSYPGPIGPYTGGWPSGYVGGYPGSVNLGYNGYRSGFAGSYAPGYLGSHAFGYGGGFGTGNHRGWPYYLQYSTPYRGLKYQEGSVGYDSVVPGSEPVYLDHP